MDFVPRQSLTVQLFHEGVWVELFDIVYARFLPQSFAEHHSTYHGGNASGIANALHACLLIGSAVRAVIVYIIGVFLAVVANTTDTAAYRGLTFIVLSEVLRIR
jgi:hypothetical protein